MKDIIESSMKAQVNVYAILENEMKLITQNASLAFKTA